MRRKSKKLSVFGELSVERAAADSEYFGGFALVAARGFEGAFYQGVFALLFRGHGQQRGVGDRGLF